MANHLKQYKKKKIIKDCDGCSSTAELRGYMQALLYLDGVKDPKMAITPNPGKMDKDFLDLHIQGQNTVKFVKWFVGILLGVGTFSGLFILVRGLFGI